MTEGKIHHPPDNGDRIGGGFGEAQTENAVHPLRMAVAAYIMPVYAAGFAEFFPMANSALHELILDQIFQGTFTDQAFF